MSEAFDDSDNPFAEDFAEPADSQRPGTFIAGIALVLPVLSGIVLFFLHSGSIAFGLGVSTVVATSVLLAIDTSLLPKVDSNGGTRPNAVLLLVACCFLWIIGYPATFFIRSRFGGPNLGGPAIAVALFFLACPIVGSMLVPTQLPTCSSAEVIGVLESLVRTPKDPNATVGDIVELEFDEEKQVRRGRCVVRGAGGEVEVEFVVEWINRDEQRFQVRTFPSELPEVDNADVKSLIAKVIRESSPELNVESIDQYEEVNFDTDQQIRRGRCVVHAESGDVEVGFLVQWINEKEATFEVRILPGELPKCDSPQVGEILEQALAIHFPDVTIRSVDEPRERSFDRERQIRFGVCRMATDSEVKDVRFVIEWTNPERTEFQVRVPPAEMPKCDSPDVVKVLDEILRGALVEVSIVSIDGHREIRFDADRQVRMGECVVHSESGDFPIEYEVNWVERDLGFFGVSVSEQAVEEP